MVSRVIGMARRSVDDREYHRYSYGLLDGSRVP